MALTPEQSAAEVRLAYARLFNDNGKPGDAKIVLADLALLSAYYGVPSIAAWAQDMRKQKLPADAAQYQIHLHELQGRRALFAEITGRAGLTESEMLTLERIARFGLARD
jgi:hypothetical protein